jgi:hypothetical protein
VLHRERHRVDQLLYRTRAEAVAQAVAFAERQHEHAWFANGEKDFVLLATFSGGA